jgi:hypothetical protein
MMILYVATLQEAGHGVKALNFRRRTSASLKLAIPELVLQILMKPLVVLKQMKKFKTLQRKSGSI